jgi:hypothetical protein
MDFARNSNFETDPKYSKAAQTWEDLLMSLQPFELSVTSRDIIRSYNEKHAEAADINDTSKILRKAPIALEQSLVKNDKLYRKNYHRDTWMVLGMSGIGIGLGVGFVG